MSYQNCILTNYLPHARSVLFSGYQLGIPKSVVLITLLFISRVSLGQQSRIPKEYQPIKEIYGDLNKDGKDEKVVVYNMSDKEVDMNGINREIIIFKKEKR